MSPASSTIKRSTSSARSTWTGRRNDSQVFVEDGKTFNLQASSIDFGNNEYDGDMRLTNGTLVIDVDSNVWTMAGELLLTGFGGSGSGVGGDAVDFTGALIASGGPTHFFVGNSRFLAGSTTSVAFGTRLQFNAPVTYDGGNHTVVGEVAITDSATINGGNLTAVEMEIGGSAALTVNGGNTIVNSFNKLSGGTFDFNGGTFRVSTGTAMFNSNVEYGGPTLGGEPTLVAENGGEAVVSFRVSIGDGAGEFGAARISGTNANGSRRSTLRGTAGGTGPT